MQNLNRLRASQVQQHRQMTRRLISAGRWPALLYSTKDRLIVTRNWAGVSIAEDSRFAVDCQGRRTSTGLTASAGNVRIAAHEKQNVTSTPFAPLQRRSNSADS